MKLKNKKLIVIAVSVLAALILFAGAAAAQESLVDLDPEDIEDKDITIGFAQKTQNAPFFKAQVEHAKQEAERLGIDIVSLDAEDSLERQISDIEDLISRGVDGIVVNPLEKDGFNSVTRKAEEEGIPVVAIDSEISDDAEYITNVTSDNHNNGVEVGRWLVNEVDDEEIRMALVSGKEGNPVGRTRRMGAFAGIVDEQLKEHGKVDFEIVAQGWGNWEQAKGMNAMQDIVVGEDFNVVLAENDSMALGALRALEGSGMVPMEDCIVAALADGQKEALKLISEGEYGATGLNDPELVTVSGVRALVSVIAGVSEPGDYPNHFTTPAVAVTEDNVDEYYDPDSLF